MTEHVFETVESEGGLGVVVDGSMAITGVTAQREEIVRCRDCKHSRIDGKALLCDSPRCLGRALAEPNGFCKWGESRRS